MSCCEKCKVPDCKTAVDLYNTEEDLQLLKEKMSHLEAYTGELKKKIAYMEEARGTAEALLHHDRRRAVDLEARVRGLIDVLEIALRRHEESGCLDTCWFPKDLASLSLETAKVILARTS